MRQRWGAALIAGATAAALLATALAFQYQQQHFVSSSYAYVTAPSTWVKAGQWERVLSVRVGLGDRVHRGELLMAVETAAGQHLAVTAPIGGQVGAVAASPGAEVAAGAPLLGLVRTSQATVEVELPESQTRRVRRGERVDVTLAAYPGRTWHGRVARLGRATLAASAPTLPTAGFSPQTEWVPVWVTLPPPPPGVRYRPGESAAAEIHV